ncbi:hypothetical protein AG1IA_10080 [Rhizoctonia solani AG-1 IA]|uniref:Uncharacterized protein n=1 Tax=Thanatephorus cucumeris (strain AG1-IA) TaxID=983506 RepID=L8WD56_THACA|nr:hypothetical protein AG1IA_10080 [Rhizoctonia solani AG-1 IA]
MGAFLTWWVGIPILVGNRREGCGASAEPIVGAHKYARKLLLRISVLSVEGIGASNWSCDTYKSMEYKFPVHAEDMLLRRMIDFDKCYLTSLWQGQLGCWCSQLTSNSSPYDSHHLFARTGC